MGGYHELEELAPRDVVSRAIVSEMRREGSPHMFLDLTHMDAEFVRRRFPRIYQTCLQFGIDLTTEPAPIHPAAHYAMGGVRVDGNTQMSSVPGLFAAGECAGGLHGANRLGGNSLSDLLVFGRLAGFHASAFARVIDCANVRAEVIYPPKGPKSCVLHGNPGRQPGQHAYFQ